MKKFLKNRGTLLLSNLLLLLMIGLHLGVYKDQANGNVQDLLTPLMVQTESPADLKELVFCEQESARPSYFNPFQALEYRYQVILNEETGEYSDCAIIERADSIFWKASLKPIAGDPEDYWGGTNSDEGPFMRPQVGTQVPNVFFFALQYLIFGAWLFLLLKPAKLAKK